MSHEPASCDDAQQILDCEQIAVGTVILLLAVVLLIAAWQIPSADHASDLGAGFVPGLCAIVLAMCGAWLLWEGRRGGLSRQIGSAHVREVQWTAAVWITAGLLMTGLLLTHIGFVLACALCYVMAMQGLKRSVPHGHGGLMRDVMWGLLLSWLVFALFTHVLGVALPALSESGWL